MVQSQRNEGQFYTNYWREQVLILWIPFIGQDRRRNKNDKPIFQEGKKKIDVI